MPRVGDVGTIAGPFGQSGKVRVYFARGVPAALAAALAKSPAPAAAAAGDTVDAPAAADDGRKPVHPLDVTLTFKRYVFDPTKRNLPV